MSTKSNHKGITKLVVCVVIGIIVLLVGLVLPAVGFLREKARRQTCVDNLRQIVLASLAYRDRLDSRLLPGIASRRWSGTSGERRGGWAWHAALLPHLGETALYNSINWSFPPDTGRENSTVLRSQVDVFLCPSDHGGLSSYAVNAGTWYDYDYAATGQGRWDGLTSHHSLGVDTPEAPGLYRFTDIAFHTVMFAEQVHWPSVSGMGPKPFQMLMDPGVELRMMKPETARQICLAMRDGEPTSARYRHEIIGQSRKSAVSPNTGLSLFPAVGQYWASVTPNRSTFVNGLLPPNSTNCLGGYKDSRNGKDAAFGLRCASSWHSGGVNIAFASGSVKFIRDDMIRDLYTSLFSIDRDDSDMYLGGVYSDFSKMPRFHGVKPEGK